MATVLDAFRSLVRPEPLLTYYDDATGERTELSGVTLGNWVAKTANLLRFGQGLGPGDTAAVLLPPHWLTAGVLLGCWSAGLSVTTSSAEASVAFVGPYGPASATDTFALSLDPFGMPFRGGPPDGCLDFSAEVRTHADQFGPVPVEPSDVALDGRTHAELLELAPPMPGRILIDVDAYPSPVTWLVAPLVARASAVLCRNTNPDRLSERLAQERATIFAPA